MSHNLVLAASVAIEILRHCLIGHSFFGMNIISAGHAWSKYTLSWKYDCEVTT